MIEISIRNNYNATLYASFGGYITQAIVINFVTLLYLTFQRNYGISLEMISFLIFGSFIIQLIADFVSAWIVDLLGYRACAVTSHILCFVGLICLSILPNVIKPIYGIVIATVLYSFGGGMIEVLVSSIVEACPIKNKSRAMSVLHSFFCWGTVFVVLLSTLFFSLFGVEKWQTLAMIWTIFPGLNAILFSLVPIKSLTEEKGGMEIGSLLKSSTFWLMFLLMCCAGAGEQAISQWVSAFAESGLKVSKTVGDLAGTCSFALMMGLSRIIYAKYSYKLSLSKFMIFSAIMCVLSYLLSALSHNPVLGLVGCAMCGFFIGISWPGTYSMAAGILKEGGTSMFALLALGGDIGCSVGPTLAGIVADKANGDLSAGILAATIFPLIMSVCLILNYISRKRRFAK